MLIQVEVETLAHEDLTEIKNEARRRIHCLVEDYLTMLSKGKKDAYNEERVKIAYVVPLLEALGWNPRTDEVLPEQATLTGRADFGLRVGGRTKVFVEMKSFTKSLDGHDTVKGKPRSYADQAIQYAWGMKADWAALTNFEETRLYDSHVKKTEDGLVWKKPIKFTEYESRFEELWLVSKHSVVSGALDAYKAKVQRPSVDEAFLGDLMTCRLLLAEDIKKNNLGLSYDQINESVQKILDRLIFIKNCEDRLIIPAESLWKRYKAWQETAIDKEIVIFMMDLKNLFRYFDQVYNGKLFEKHACEDLKVSNDVFETIIDTLYGDGQHLGYNFSVIPGDVLGQAYELYIGSVIKEREGHVDALEIVTQPSKRKAHGIYYTPEPVVDCIVRGTLGNVLAKCRTPEDLSKIKVLDPACGSGSFLIKAFDVIKEWYETYNNLNRVRGVRNTLDAHIVPVPNIEERILTENLYGVDLDPQAVEITILNLSLKAVKTREKLPYIADHIKCGNSLIDDERIAGDRAFKWKKEFGTVIDNGGFDVLIGNPPYVRLQTLNRDQVDFFYSHYRAATKHYDIYALFVEKGMSLLKDNGLLGFILPSKFFVADYGIGLRKLIAENKYLQRLVNFKDHQIFDGATTYTCLLFLKKSTNETFEYLEAFDKNALKKTRTLSSDIFKHLTQKQPETEGFWNFSLENDNTLMAKLRKKNLKLGDVAADIFQGFLTGRDKFFFVDIIEHEGAYAKIRNSYDEKEHVVEKSLLKKLLRGKEIKRWGIGWKGTYVIYPYTSVDNTTKLISKDEMEAKYPKAYEYFLHYQKELMSSDTSEAVDETNWYRFRRARSIEQFQHRKILTQVLCSRNSFTLDDNGEYYFVGGGNAGGFGIILKDDYVEERYFILSLLNSKLLEYFLKKTSTLFRGGFYSCGKKFIENLPIVMPEEGIRRKLTELAKGQIHRTCRLIEIKDDKTREWAEIEEECLKADDEIDEIVCEIYGLAEKERESVLVEQ